MPSIRLNPFFPIWGRQQLYCLRTTLHIDLMHKDTLGEVIADRNGHLHDRTLTIQNPHGKVMN